jgi:hypothetical protein
MALAWWWQGTSALMPWLEGPRPPALISEHLVTPGNAFESARTFQVWGATVSHDSVLLRSVKTEAEPTRIDILCKPVHAMKIRALMQGLRVREADSREAAGVAQDIGEELADYHRVFVVESGDFRGYLVAGVMVASEDLGEYYDPDQFGMHNF